MKMKLSQVAKPWVFVVVIFSVIGLIVATGIFTHQDSNPKGPGDNYFTGDMELNGIHRDDVDYEPPSNDNDE